MKTTYSKMVDSNTNRQQGAQEGNSTVSQEFNEVNLTQRAQNANDLNHLTDQELAAEERRRSLRSGGHGRHRIDRPLNSHIQQTVEEDENGVDRNEETTSYENQESTTNQARNEGEWLAQLQQRVMEGLSLQNRENGNSTYNSRPRGNKPDLRHITLPKFDGKIKSNVKLFIVELEDVQRMDEILYGSDWSDVLVNLLRVCLTDAAKIWYYQLDVQTRLEWSWEEAKKALMLRFGDNRTPLQIMTALSECKKKSYETFAEFLARLIGIGQNLPKVLRDDAIAHAFCEGVAFRFQPSLKLLTNSPLQTYVEAAERMASGNGVEGFAPTFPKSHDKTSSQNANSTKKGIMCHWCGELGHKQSDGKCVKGPLCYNCHENGHISSDCKKPRHVQKSSNSEHQLNGRGGRN